MVVLWGLQVIFLNNFYEGMKIQQTKSTVQDVNEAYVSYDTNKFKRKVSSIAKTNDLYIYLVSTTGEITSFQPAEEVAGEGYYFQQIDSIEKYRLQSPDGGVMIRIKGVDNTKEVLVYSDLLISGGKEQFKIYLFSPLWPVKSTINILRNQLIYITLIALIMACIVSFYLSSRITRPIRDIAASADRLAEGEYGIVFKGGHYTEINNLADTLTRTSIELEKTDVIQKDLVANVSHDLRTPLTMIKSYAEMIRDLSGDNPVKRNAHLQTIIEEADRLNNLVNDMLNLSRMQSRRIDLELSTFDLLEATEQMLHAYDILEENEDYHITLEHDRDVYMVTADRQRIIQVMNNLVSNAVKYCGEDKVILISLYRAGKNVRFEVTDHGQGIAEDEITHVWERYYKSSTHHVRSTTGTGLGLSIVKEVLKLHNAPFGVDSQIGAGSTFWFELPLSKTRKNS